MLKWGWLLLEGCLGRNAESILLFSRGSFLRFNNCENIINWMLRVFDCTLKMQDPEKARKVRRNVIQCMSQEENYDFAYLPKISPFSKIESDPRYSGSDVICCKVLEMAYDNWFVNLIEHIIKYGSRRFLEESRERITRILSRAVEKQNVELINVILGRGNIPAEEILNNMWWAGCDQISVLRVLFNKLTVEDLMALPEGSCILYLIFANFFLTMLEDPKTSPQDLTKICWICLKCDNNYASMTIVIKGIARRRCIDEIARRSTIEVIAKRRKNIDEIARRSTIEVYDMNALVEAAWEKCERNKYETILALMLSGNIPRETEEYLRTKILDDKEKSRKWTCTESAAFWDILRILRIRLDG
jgi:hypothetical protein